MSTTRRRAPGPPAPPAAPPAPRRVHCSPPRPPVRADAALPASASALGCLRSRIEENGRRKGSSSVGNAGHTDGGLLDLGQTASPCGAGIKHAVRRTQPQTSRRRRIVHAAAADRQPRTVRRGTGRRAGGRPRGPSRCRAATAQTCGAPRQAWEGRAHTNTLLNRATQGVQVVHRWAGRRAKYKGASTC